MVNYICERCIKEFSQKSHYNVHMMKKNPCKDNMENIKKIIHKVVDEKLLQTLPIIYEKDKEYMSSFLKKMSNGKGGFKRISISPLRYAGGKTKAIGILLNNMP